ncbi:hypothetical protein [Haladaptatus sp. CMAA 1911]|uniref:hypothetical protein n=1 Tax=unclassified Haladaptatus TaxID=2622732 RepID=UPI003753F4A5
MSEDAESEAEDKVQSSSLDKVKILEAESAALAENLDEIDDEKYEEIESSKTTIKLTDSEESSETNDE